MIFVGCYADNTPITFGPYTGPSVSTAGHHVFGLLMINCSGANPVSARNEARRVTRAERPLGSEAGSK